MPSPRSFASLQKAGSGQLHVVTRGVGLGLLAFVLSYVLLPISAVLYHLDASWLIHERGPLLSIGQSGGHYYIPGAVEMLQSHMILWAAIDMSGGGSIGSSLFGVSFPVEALLPGLSLLFVGAVMGYLYPPQSLDTSVRLSAWLLPGYVLPLSIFSAISLLVTLRVYDYAHVGEPTSGYLIVFAPSLTASFLTVSYAFALVLLCGTMGIVLSKRIFDSVPKKTSAT